MGNRQYSDNDKATALAALDANAGNVSKTSKQLRIPRATLQEWIAGRVSADVPEFRQIKKGELAERLKEVAHLLIDAIPGKIGDATLQQIATSIGIAVDKAQLLDGKPTDRTEVLDNLSDDERAARVAAVLERARNRRDRQPTSD